MEGFAMTTTNATVNLAGQEIRVAGVSLALSIDCYCVFLP